MYSQPPADPIISRLRPRSVQEIIDQAFRLYRRYFFTFLAITAVVFVPVNLAVQLLSVAVEGDTTVLERSTLPSASFDTSESLNQAIILVIVLFLVFMALAILVVLLQYLSHGALTSAVADSHLDRPVSFGRAYRTMLKHLGPLLGMIGLQILIGIGLFLPAIVAFVLAIAAITAGGESGLGAGFTLICLAFILMFVTVILYTYVFVRLSVIIPAIMVENLGPVQAVRRSWQLVQDYWWRTFALMLVLNILGAVISAGPAYLVVALITLFTGSFDPVLTTSITGIVSVITEAFFIPLSLTCYTLYYFDLRVRKEGFDLETALDQRYAPPGSAPGGYYAGPQGQYPPAGGYSPPQLGYGAQPQPPPPPQYSAYPQQAYPQGYEYPQQSYAQPEAPAQGATNLPASPGGGEGTGANTGTVEAHGEEAPRSESLGFSTPSITEQAARPPSVGSDPSAQDSPRADTPSTGKLEPPRHGSDTPAPDER